MLLSTAVSYKYMNLFRQPIPRMPDKDVAEVSVRAYFNVPTGTDVLGDLKSVLEGLLTRA